MTETTRRAADAGKRFVIERTFAACTLDDVWALWTTRSGIESWWGPEGFEVEVVTLDLRPGGALVYRMTAVGPEQVAFMRRAGLPLSSETKATYTEVSPPHRLAYAMLADFVPGVAPYEVAASVELRPCAEGVTLVLRFDAMHDDDWSARARAGHESQLRKLAARLAAAAA